MKTRWTPQAEADRSAVWEYLADRDTAAALRIDDAIDHAVTRIAEYPLSAMPGQ